ncbi:MAG: DUF4199 domain-containing protein [Ferruginibacter sp.]
MKNIKTEIKWVLIFAAMILLWMLAEKLTGLTSTHIDQQAFYSNFVAIPAIAIYVFALLDKRKRDYGGFMTYKQGFISGLIITLIYTALTPLVQYIVSVIILPEYFPNIIRYSVSSKILTQAEADKYFTLKNYIVIGLMGAFLMGTFTTAIVALFVKKTKK